MFQCVLFLHWLHTCLRSSISSLHDLSDFSPTQQLFAEAISLVKKWNVSKVIRNQKKICYSVYKSCTDCMLNRWTPMFSGGSWSWLWFGFFFFLLDTVCLGLVFFLIPSVLLVSCWDCLHSIFAFTKSIWAPMTSLDESTIKNPRILIAVSLHFTHSLKIKFYLVIF